MLSSESRSMRIKRINTNATVDSLDSMLATWKIKQCRYHVLHDIIALLLAIFHNSTTRTLLLKERIIVRTQIYENQSSLKNKEQTWELFFNIIINFSDKNLSLWEILIIDSQSLRVYQEFKSHTIFNVSSMIRIQVTYNLQEISHELHVISLVSLMMLKLSSLSI